MRDNMTEKERQVFEVLLLPIDACTRKKINIEIYIQGNQKMIKTGMRYLPRGSKSASLDPDVSDIAIRFYEVIYDIPRILDANRSPMDDEFIGDTMNSSFKDINYHCLANFWILPTKLGRTLEKYSKSRAADRMDYFLWDLQNHYSIYEEMFPRYFGFFQNYQNFCRRHFLNESHLLEGAIQSTLRKEEIISIIEKRAATIAREKCDDLYNLFFNELKLCRGPLCTDAEGGR